MLSETEWVDAVYGFQTLFDQGVGGTLACASFATLVLAFIGAIVAPIATISRFIDDKREGKVSLRAIALEFVYSWSMLLPLIWVASNRNEKRSSRSRTIVYILLYSGWILGVTGFWLSNIVNVTIMVSEPEHQRPGEVYTTSFAMFVVLLTALYSIVHLRFHHRIEQREAEEFGLPKTQSFYVTPFALATAWLWLGVLDNIAVYGTAVFPLAWPLVVCSAIWVVWSFVRLRIREARLRKPINGAGRG